MTRSLFAVAAAFVAATLAQSANAVPPTRADFNTTGNARRGQREER